MRRPEQNQGLRILIADDSELAADMLATTLRNDGHSVLVVYEGQAALDAAMQEEFDVAILDIEMPKVDGHRVADSIKKRWPSTVLIAVSGYRGADMTDKSRRAGFLVNFVKPVDEEDIARAVKQILQGFLRNGSP